MKFPRQVRYQLEVLIVDVDGALGEIGRVQERFAVLIGGDGQAGVDRTGIGRPDDGIRRVHARTPTRDGAVDGVEQEDAGAGLAVFGDIEPLAAGVKDGTGRRTLHRAR